MVKVLKIAFAFDRPTDDKFQFGHRGKRFEHQVQTFMHHSTAPEP